MFSLVKLTLVLAIDFFLYEQQKIINNNRLFRLIQHKIF